MYIIKIQLYTFRMSKTSPRSVGSRSVVFFKKNRKIYEYASVLP